MDWWANMKIFNTVAWLFVAMVATTAIAASPAFAHSFKVALVIPSSSATLEEARQVRQGFMVATAERDSHPDQESDGHLGGLDVYVSVLDDQGDAMAGIRRLVARAEPDILAVFGSEQSLPLVEGLLEGTTIALLPPGQSPFANPGLPAVARFISSYQTAFGEPPSDFAARGYNAARRIDAAVRAQGGVDDIAALRRVFDETMHGFSW